MKCLPQKSEVCQRAYDRKRDTSTHQLSSAWCSLPYWYLQSRKTLMLTSDATHMAISSTCKAYKQRQKQKMSKHSTFCSQMSVLWWIPILKLICNTAWICLLMSVTTLGLPSVQRKQNSYTRFRRLVHCTIYQNKQPTSDSCWQVHTLWEYPIMYHAHRCWNCVICVILSFMG